MLVMSVARSRIIYSNTYPSAISELQAFEGTLSRTANLMTAPQGTVWKAMWRQHGKTFMIAGFIKLVHDCVMFLGPFVLEQLLIFLEKGGTMCRHPLTHSSCSCGY